MPYIEATMIVGYGPDEKTRLATALTRGVRSVMNAPMDAIIVVFNEVAADNWVRGGVTRTPGPALPAAIDVVKRYLAAPGASEALAEGFNPPSLPAGLVCDVFTEALTDDGSLVFAEGADADGAKLLLRVHVRVGKIADIALWRALM